MTLGAFVPGPKTEPARPSGPSRPFRLGAGWIGSREARVYVAQLSSQEIITRIHISRGSFLRASETPARNRYGRGRRGLHDNFPARQFAEIQIRRRLANVAIQDM